MHDPASAYDPEKALDDQPAYDSNDNVSRDKDKRERLSRRADGSRVKGEDVGDPFGDESEGDVKYRTMAWWQASAIMIAETISIGILSLPSVLSSIGLVPGAIVVFGLGIVTTYTGYVIGQFRAAHPWVHNMGDAGYVLFRPYGPRAAKFGREFLGGAQVIFLIFAMASHVLTWTLALSTITSNATCTIVWSVVGLVLFWIGDIPRTMRKLSWLACASFVSIFSAVLVTMIAIGVENPAPGTYQLFTHTSFAAGFSSVTTLIFAYTGHVGFFSFISEMRDPADFTKALIVLQIFDTAMYVTAAIVIYYYAGTMVKSPALASTAPVVAKVAYGIAIPTILIAGVILGHVNAKLVYVRLFRGTKYIHERSWASAGSWAWLLITAVLWIIAWIIAESIPEFNDLLALVSSLFGSWFCYGLSGVFWLFINWPRHGEAGAGGSIGTRLRRGWLPNWRKQSLTVVNWALIAMGFAICGVGLYATGKGLHEAEAQSGGGGSWSCTPPS